MIKITNSILIIILFTLSLSAQNVETVKTMEADKIMISPAIPSSIFLQQKAIAEPM